MRQRRRGEQIELTDEELRILSQESGLVFAEQLLQAAEYSYKLTEEEEGIKQQIEGMTRISNIFTTVRNNITFTEIESKGGGDRGNISEIESGEKQPNYFTIIKFCAALGYGFFHPITQEMLYKSWLARRPGQQ